MDLNAAKSVLAVIREEALRRDDVERDPNWPDEQGQADQAFISEFCLIFLVALRHHLDRELVNMAARANHGGAEITPEQFEREIVRLNPNGKRTDWSEVNRLLGIDEQNRPSLIAALRLLANDYKHHPHTMPGKALVKHLNLTATSGQHRYDELSKSEALRDGLALCAGLSKGSSSILIAERFVESVEKYLEDTVRKAHLSRVRWRAVSLVDGLH